MHSSEIIPGPKWTGLFALLHTWPRWRDYECIWLRDDDLLATSKVKDTVSGSRR